MIKTILPLSIIGGLRFFGLFVVMPTLSIYALKLTQNSSENMLLVGLSISAYALSQILFQIPFGILGDKYSKKHLIAFGLFIFMIGSLICAYATSIEMMIIGRIIQGAGAIGSLVSAKIADLIKEEKRGYAMAFMGISIFLSFMLAMVIGSKVGTQFGTDKLFLLTAILSFLGIILLYAFVPHAPHLHYEAKKPSYTEILKNTNLNILNISVLIQKFLMTFTFTIIPIMLVRDLNIGEENIWKVFVLAIGVAFFTLPPSMIIAEKHRKPKIMLLLGIVLFIAAYATMGFGDKQKVEWIFIFGVVAFFCAFCIQEPILQNLASKYPKNNQKSFSLGIFTTFGYLGSFLGGIIGGSLFSRFDFAYIAGVICVLMLLWLVLMAFLNNPKKMQNLYINLDKISGTSAIDGVSGVIEFYKNTSENLLIIKFDNTKISQEKLESMLGVESKSANSSLESSGGAK